MAAPAAQDRRGNKADKTTNGTDLAAAVKILHLKKFVAGFSKYNTNGKRVNFLAGLSTP